MLNSKKYRILVTELALFVAWGIPSIWSPPVAIGDPPSSTFPTWRQALTFKDVWGVATSQSTSAAGMNAGQLVDWNGFAANGGRVWAGLGGGHLSGGSPVNDMWILDLNQDTPQWVMLNPGSPISLYKPDYPYYYDAQGGVNGLPGARHTYYTPQFLPGSGGAHDRVMYFLSGFYYPQEVNAPDANAGHLFVDGFDIVTNTWDPIGTWASTVPLAQDIGFGSPTTMDPRTDDVWIYGSGYTGNMWKWTKATNSWQNYGPLTGMSQSWWYRASLIDATRNRYILMANNANQLDVIDGISNPATMVGRTQTITLPPGLTSFQDYAMLIHDTINDRYLIGTLWTDASGTYRQSLFAMDPQTWVVTYLNELPDPIWLPAHPSNGILGRLAYHPSLNGLSWTPHSDSPTYFMPIVGGLAPPPPPPPPPPPGGLPNPGLSHIPNTVNLSDSLTVDYPSGYNVSFNWTFTPQTSNTSGSGSPTSGSMAASSFRSSAQTGSLASHGLTQGLYQVSVQAVDNTNASNVSNTISQSITLTSTVFSQVQVYPNPWRSDRYASQPFITFNSLPPNATVKIFTVSGHWVKTLTVNGTYATWPLTTDSGDKVASGIYLYVIKADNGQKSTGQVVVIK